MTVSLGAVCPEQAPPERLRDAAAAADPEGFVRFTVSEVRPLL
jgi:hypothetical protein